MIIRYNTFEKASFDQYLIASISKSTSSENVANKYINDITGDGSLNLHFKKMYENIRVLDDSDIEKILSDSLYPVLKIDASNRYLYYPELKISIMKNKLYEGNISDNEMLPKLLIPEGEFQSSDIEPGKEKQDIDTYTVKINDDKIRLQLSKNITIDISNDLFTNIVDIQIKNLKGYKGDIRYDIDGKQWNIMSNSKLNEIVKKLEYTFIYNGDHFLITNTYLKKTIVAQVYGIYLYKETIYDYDRKNRNYCEVVVNHLLKKDLISTFKTTKLIKILDSLKEVDTQKYLNYLLGIKESKDLTSLGFDLIHKNVVSNWSEEAIKNFVKYMKTDQELISAYKVSGGNDFTIPQLYKIYRIQRTILLEEDLNKVKEYLHDRKGKIDEMKKIIGEITLSGRREKTRRLKNNQDVKKYRSLSHELQGHFKKNIEELSDEEINLLYQKVLEYQRLDTIMIKLIEENLL